MRHIVGQLSAVEELRDGGTAELGARGHPVGTFSAGKQPDRPRRRLAHKPVSGTSRSRLSTYASGKVVPAATLLFRMRELADSGGTAERPGSDTRR